MERIPEPELMEDDEQARAYAEADFEEPHSNFILRFRETFPEVRSCGYVLDLGCGPGDISVRFAQAFPGCEIHGIDGSRAMLKYGRMIMGREGDLTGRVRLCHGLLPDFMPPRRYYDIIISNSLLHHLRDPLALWDAIRRHAGPGALVFIMDLMRPAGADEAVRLVRKYASAEPEILQHDFYHSLLAAYRPEEVREQLRAASLDHFIVEEVDDRHLTAHGRI